MNTAAVVEKKPKTSTQRMKRSVASSLPEEQKRTSKSSTSKLVRRTGYEPLSQHDLDLIEKLARMPDSEINTSDIPEVKENAFANRSGILSSGLFKPYKLQITLRLDADVIAWARRGGDGYQSRINAALRRAMMEDVKQGK